MGDRARVQERATVRRLLQRVCAVPIRKEIIIVDNGSIDGTAEVVREIACSCPDDLMTGCASCGIPS